MELGQMQRVINVPVTQGQIRLIVDDPNPSFTPDDVDEDALVGELPTLVCVHGWALDHGSFAPQCTLSERGIRVARFDRRGFGSSTLEPNFAQELMDLNHIIMTLDGPLILYGVSQGARLVLRTVALLCPGRVVGMVVQGGHLDGYEVPQTPEETIPFERYTQWIAEGDIARFQRDWIHHPLVAGGNGSMSVEARRELISSYIGSDLVTPGALPVPIDIRDRLRQCRIPTLVLTGSEETPSRRIHGAAIANLTGGRIEEIEGGGHLCNLSHPARTNAALAAFLGQCRARTGLLV